MSETGHAKDYDIRRQRTSSEPIADSCRSCSTFCSCRKNSQQLAHIEPNVVKRLPLIRPISAKTTPRPIIKMVEPYNPTRDKLPSLIKSRGAEAFDVNKDVKYPVNKVNINKLKKLFGY